METGYASGLSWEGLRVGRGYDYLSGNLSSLLSWYHAQSSLTRSLIVSVVFLVSISTYLHSLYKHITKYPYVLDIDVSKVSGVRIGSIRLEDSGKTVIDHVMDNYLKIVNLEEPEVFKYVWNPEDEVPKLFPKDVDNISLINNRLIDEKNEELKTIVNRDRSANALRSGTLFKLDYNDRNRSDHNNIYKGIFSYTGRNDDYDKGRALRHLLGIRDQCQVLEQVNKDRHDLRVLSMVLESMILAIKSPDKWEDNERDYLTKPWVSKVDYASNESNESRNEWYLRIYDGTVGWGFDYIRNLAHWDNPDAIRDIIDPRTGSFVGQYSPDQDLQE